MWRSQSADDGRSAGSGSGSAGRLPIPAPKQPNNPFRRLAGLYDHHLSLPIISTIRRQEARVVSDLLARHARSSDQVLEVGPGTGFYTLVLAPRVRHVLAVEDSAPMAAILTRKLAAAGVLNVTVLNQDFLALATARRCDLGVAVGVLDYLPDPAGFVSRLCGAARRAVILTLPQRGLWGSCFALGGRLRGTAIYRYQRSAPGEWAPGWHCTVAEVGLKSRLTKGLTLVVALERAQDAAGV